MLCCLQPARFACIARHKHCTNTNVGPTPTTPLYSTCVRDRHGTQSIRYFCGGSVAHLLIISNNRAAACCRLVERQVFNLRVCNTKVTTYLTTYNDRASYLMTLLLSLYAGAEKTSRRGLPRSLGIPHVSSSRCIRKRRHRHYVLYVSTNRHSRSKLS